MVQTKDDIIKVLHEHKDEIFAYGIDEVWLFGSFLKGLQRKNSDVDLMVHFPKPHSLGYGYVDMEKFFKKIMGRKVDIHSTENYNFVKRKTAFELLHPRESVLQQNHEEEHS